MLQEKKGNCLRKRTSLNRPFAFLFFPDVELLWKMAEKCAWIPLLPGWSWSSRQFWTSEYFLLCGHKLLKSSILNKLANSHCTSCSKYCLIRKLLSGTLLTGANTVFAFYFNYIIRFSPLVRHTSRVNASYNFHKAQVYWKLKLKCSVLWKFRH